MSPNVKSKLSFDGQNIVSVLITLIVLGFFITMALLGTHELAHAYTAKFLGCKNVLISFDIFENLVFTNLSCQKDVDVFFIGIAGLIATIILSFSFLLSAKATEKKLWLISMGMSTLLALSDIQVIFGDIIFFLSFFIGLLVLVIGAVHFVEAHFEFE